MSAHFTFPPALMDKVTAAYYINVSPRKFDELTGRGEITAHRLDGKKVYRRDDLDALAASLPEWVAA